MCGAAGQLEDLFLLPELLQSDSMQWINEFLSNSRNPSWIVFGSENTSIQNFFSRKVLRYSKFECVLKLINPNKPSNGEGIYVRYWVA